MHCIKPEQRVMATDLRNGATDAERSLGKSLRGDLLNELRFRRQFPLGTCIVDFVCSVAHAIVELDGAQHAESVHDEKRAAWLKSQGFRVLRFWNNDVLQNMEGVMQMTFEAINSAKCVLPTLLGGEGRGAVKTPNTSRSPSAHPSATRRSPPHPPPQTSQAVGDGT